MSKKQEESTELKRGDTVVLVYTEDDLLPEDLGMSGMVLESPLSCVKYYLKSKYMYIGCLKDDEDRVVIQRLDYEKRSKGEPKLLFRSYIRKWTKEDEDKEWEQEQLSDN